MKINISVEIEKIGSVIGELNSKGVNISRVNDMIGVISAEYSGGKDSLLGIDGVLEVEDDGEVSI